MTTLRIAARFPVELLWVMLHAVGHAVQAAWCRSHFFVKSRAYVESRHVSRAATLGPNVRIGHRVTVGPRVSIGDYTYVNQDSIIDSGSLGKFCSIGARVSIGPLDHPMQFFSTHPGTYLRSVWGIVSESVPYAQKAPPLVGNDVWIGRDAIVMRGVRIGDGAIIGANAVVTKDVPAYSIVVGVPARVIGRRFDERTANDLIATHWWDDPREMQRLLAGNAADVSHTTNSMAT